jgi:hypothetical protein
MYDSCMSCVMMGPSGAWDYIVTGKTYIHTHTLTYTYSYTYTYTYSYTYSYIHTYTYTYAYIRTYRVCGDPWPYSSIRVHSTVRTKHT